MKKFAMSFLAAIILLPNIALGAMLLSGEEVYVDETVNEDLYAAGGLLNVQEGVNGDLVIGGGRVYVNGIVTQDLMAGAGDISISGEIGDDVRVAAGSIEIDATIKGDLMAAGGDLTITNNSFVGEDVNLAGGSLAVGGTINGDLRLVGGAVYLNADVKGNVALVNFDSITFGPKARVQGTLWYRSTEELVLPENFEAGEVVFKEIPPSQVKENLPKILAGFSLFSLLATLLFGLFMIWLLRYYVLHAANTAYEATLKSLGVGFLALILTPIIVLIFLATTIGIPLALVSFFTWLIFLYVGKIMAAMLIGFKVVRVDEKSSFGRVYGSFALGALIYTLISLVPVVGWVVNFIFVLIALGSMVIYEVEVFGELRKKKLV